MIRISEIIENYKSELVDLRRWFHQHPELGFEEIETSKKIISLLKEWGYDITDLIAKTGVVAKIHEQGSGIPIAVRIDMDGLPVTEETDLEFKSKNLGKMHACGHDMHLAIGLIIAKLFSEIDYFKNIPVTFIFQPAEELLSGAQKMVDAEVMKLINAEAIFGLHVWNQLEVGKIALNSGAIMASIDAFEVKIFGKGGHGASPENAIDPIIALAQIVLASQSIISRNISAKDEAVLSITSIQSGNTVNVIPEKGKLLGSIRTYQLDVRNLIKKRFEEIVINIAASLNCEAEVKWLQSAPALTNNQKLILKIQTSLDKLPYKNVEDFKIMGSEDASIFWEEIPGAYVFVGAQAQNQNKEFAHHHPKFLLDEKALEVGLITLLSSISTYEDIDWAY